MLAALDRLDLWQNTVVIFTGDHGEMNGAHRMTQKGGDPLRRGGRRQPDRLRAGRAAGAAHRRRRLAPRPRAHAAWPSRASSEEEIRERYPHLKGRSLKAPITDPSGDGPRGSVNAPGDGALLCWDGLNMLDTDWALTGALKELSDMSLEFSEEAVNQPEKLQGGGTEIWRARLQASATSSAPWWTGDTSWCAGSARRNTATRPPSTSSTRRSDVALYDLVNDPGELENLAHPDHPGHDPALVERMLAKLHALVRHEIGEDRVPVRPRHVRHARGEIPQAERLVTAGALSAREPAGFRNQGRYEVTKSSACVPGRALDGGNDT